MVRICLPNLIACLSLALQTIFKLMDSLHHWIKQAAAYHERAQRYAKSKSKNAEDFQPEPLTITEPATRLLASIPQKSLAEASLRCKAFARAVMHFERHLREQLACKLEDDLLEEFEQMLKIYSNIDEPDGMDGISSILFKHGAIASLDRQILERRSAGRWELVQSCYEVELQRDPGSTQAHFGLLDCFKNMGHYGKSSTFAGNVIPLS